MLKFIVVSDLHIVPESELSNSLDTTIRMRQAIEHINANHSDARFCVFAGDLTDRGEDEAYQRFRHELAPLTMPYHLVLGNHDNREAFWREFGQAGSSRPRTPMLPLIAKDIG